MQAVIRHEPEELTEWITGRLGATQRLARTVLHRLIVEGQSGSGDGSVPRGQPGRHVADSRAGRTDIRFRPPDRWHRRRTASAREGISLMIRPGDPSSLLNADRRSAGLRRLRDAGATEVLVVGGGITGVGVALDAAARGMQVTLVERHDLAHGTSRWSSKLIHGGLRYLATGHVDVALESAKERHLLITKIAPHLIRALPTLIPNYGGVDPYVSYAGLVAGDVLRKLSGTKRDVLPRARFVNASTALNMCPALRPDGLKGGIVGWDGQVEDDARLVVAVARTPPRRTAPTSSPTSTPSASATAAPPCATRTASSRSPPNTSSRAPACGPRNSIPGSR